MAWVPRMLAGIATAALAGSGMVVVGAVASAAPEQPDATVAIVVCESAIESRSGIDTSSAMAMRVPVGTAVPAGCREV